MEVQLLMLRQGMEAVERALCKIRKVEQIEDVTVTIEEAGEILGISRGLAYELVNNKTIPSISLGRRKFIPINSLARMLVEADEQVWAEGQTEDAI